ncbi:aminopeptidase N [Serratia symbiotica]|uniref:Aminopeptidase N n=2 Tax=Serratia symbiotica TaxID=138074 RepID=A0A068Z5J3_9GAMM|nr:aminopeptidase N [Serratia symbiotica]MBF1995577.1 aminopeptidase N [Serratia symbiotica]QLH62915.1 aminopeptidase N [Serratia symbiotica]QTP15421.1 aminopeptidase N [Serratia symbiotica]CDS57483.1 aminopeptidase N [Serratia symbiotica]
MTQQPQVQYRHNYRAPDYTITHIDLDFELDADITHVTAVSKIKRQGDTEAALVLDGEELTLVSIQVDGQAWSAYRFQENQLVIDGLPDHFTLTIVNDIYPAKNTALEGLYQSGDALCTQCEAEGFRHITYYLDRPDVLARFTTRIVADKARYPFLLSNGNRIGQGELEGGRHWVQWHDPFPKPCYLFALVAGDFEVLRDSFTTRSGREVALELFVDHGNLDRADWAMTSLKNSMKWDETRFGLEYDLDIYMIVAVDFFNMGAMENKGLNIFNAKYVLAKAETATDTDYLNIEAVIGHEYFHNWTGNRVTCRDWFQLSLKEGLTVFRDQEFSSDLGSRAVNRISNVRVMRGAQFAEDASPMAHAIRPDKVIEMNNFYTLTVYQKGAEVIRMLHTLLGEVNFQKGMQLYFERHDGSAATCDDFVQAMEDASNVDLSLFRRWYSQFGTPLLTIRDDYDAENQQYRLHISQKTTPTAEQPEKLPLHIPLDIELYDSEGSVIALQKDGSPINNVLNLTDAEQTFVFDGVAHQPVPSLLREFSAPVKLDYPYSDQQLTFLMQHARNEFARWDAAQSLLATYIKLNVVKHQQQQPLTLPLHVVDAFRALLLDEQLDPALAAQILTFPSENEMGELFATIDPEAISAVHEAIVRCLAEEMADEWLAVYHANKTDSYRVEHSDIAKRTLRNVCLGYLAFGEDMALADKRVSEQYYQADNMTDLLAALAAAVAAQLPCRDALLAAFDERWHNDGLVMDKWFVLQGSSPAADVLNKVRGLLQHRSFSLNNPNRTRSLIGGFASGNPAAFHAADGSGYQFLVEILSDLNQRNPQIAARLIEPLIHLKRYDAGRQALMRQALEQLKGLENLSGDLYEKISKALNA